MEGTGELLVLCGYEKPCSQGDLAGALSQELLIIAMRSGYLEHLRCLRPNQSCL